LEFKVWDGNKNWNATALRNVVDMVVAHYTRKPVIPTDFDRALLALPDVGV
jgi:hypothetical protein